jgi:putative MFS transporter
MPTQEEQQERRRPQRGRTRRPWWIPAFLGGVPDIDPALIRLVGVVSLVLFFEAYDNSLLIAALKQIAEGLDMGESELGPYLGIIRLGSLPALLVAPVADRLGRRKVFLASIAGFSAGTLLTAFARRPEEFVIAQMLTRIFSVAAIAVAMVIITEEFPARHRGWGIGMVSALAAVGYGVGAGFFAAIEIIPGGWRGLYVLGGLPLLLIPYWRRAIPETRRFREHADSIQVSTGMRSALAAALLPFKRFLLEHPARAVVISVAALLVSMGDACVFQFVAYIPQKVHGWAPGHYSLMVLFGGGFGIIGNVVGGRLGDRRGRRIVGATFFGIYPAAAWLFYQGPGLSLPLAFALIVFTGTAGGVILRALATELFPTSYRGTSSGWLAFVQTLGWTAGLMLLRTAGDGAGGQEGVEIARFTAELSLAVLVGGLVLLLLPETSRRELEEISTE